MDSSKSLFYLCFRYINPNKVSELATINDSATSLQFGANVDLSTLLSHCKDRINDSPMYSTICNMLDYFASRQIRNVASIAGNIVTASPISDMCPILLSLDAKIICASIEKSGSKPSVLTERKISLSTFFLSYRQTQLGSEEVVKCVDIPKLSKGEHEDKLIEFCMPFKQAR